MAKLLGTNVGSIQQDLSILLKDESIEVRKQSYIIQCLHLYFLSRAQKIS